MIHRPGRRNRKGALMLESSIVYNVALMLTLGTIVIGLGIFRYQEIAWLAREGSRWAAVHGPTYQREQNVAAPTSNDVLVNAINPRLCLLNSANLTCTLTNNSGTATVTLTYNWTPEAYLSPIKFASTSSALVTY